VVTIATVYIFQTFLPISPLFSTSQKVTHVNVQAQSTKETTESLAYVWLGMKVLLCLPLQLWVSCMLPAPITTLGYQILGFNKLSGLPRA
jgi:hypothetical protein